MLRTIDKCFICSAIIGKCSQICPSPDVEIGRKGPPVGAPGFKSQMSIVAGPPPIHSNIADFRFFRISSAPAAMAPPIVIDAAIAAPLPAMCAAKCRRVIPVGVRNEGR